MLRCLIQDVSLDSFSQAGQTLIHLHWQTGAVTTVSVPRPTTAEAHRLDAGLVAQIRQLAQTHSDDALAEILNQQGLKTRQGLSWTYRRVMGTRRRYAIPTACPITPRDNQPRGDGLLSVTAAAHQLTIRPNTILVWARQGIVASEHKPGLCPIWVRLTPDDVARLTQVTPPANSLRIHQACQVLHLSEAQLWAEIKTGRYTVYRVRQNKHWEFRIVTH